MKNKNPLADCTTCERIHKKNKKESPCEDCKKPIIFDANEEALLVYGFCKNQLVMAPMGGPISIRIDAIKATMEILDIGNKAECLEKVLMFAEELFKKDE